MRPAERHTRRAVREDPVSDRALPAAADFVLARRRIHESAAEILPASERPFDAEACANLADIPPPDPKLGVVNPSRSVAVAPNSGIVVSGTAVAPVGIVPTRLKTRRPGTTPIVARRSVSTNPE